MINISGKNMQVGISLSKRIEYQIAKLLKKYFNGRGGADVVLSKESSGFICDVKINLPNKIVLYSHSQSYEDAISVYLAAEEKIAKQLRRYKRRLNNITREEVLLEKAVSYTLMSDPQEESNNDTDIPLIIAEEAYTIQTLTVSDAIMRLNLSNLDYLMFRNGGNKHLNLVYRRNDGHFGWLDPEQ